MTRYLYRDPFAPIYMAKQFGMKTWVGGFCLQPESIRMFQQFLLDWVEDCFVEIGGAIIDKDSLHLLEPKVGDMVTNIGMMGWRVTRTEGEKIYCAHDYYGRKSEMTVIQRDGKPFFWPESDAA